MKRPSLKVNCQLLAWLVISKTVKNSNTTIDGSVCVWAFVASIAEDFLNRTASQLTYHGLCELNRELADGQLCVFFRNNHFVTLHKHQVMTPRILLLNHGDVCSCIFTHSFID